MSEFSVKPAELDKKAEELKNLNEQLRLKCQEYAEKGGSLSASFEGDTASKFYQEVSNHSSKMNEFVALVDQYYATMKEDIQKYIQMEQQAQEVVSGKG